jgi:hypothetical protein
MKKPIAHNDNNEDEDINPIRVVLIAIGALIDIVAGSLIEVPGIRMLLKVISDEDPIYFSYGIIFVLIGITLIVIAIISIFVKNKIVRKTFATVNIYIGLALFSLSALDSSGSHSILEVVFIAGTLLLIAP